MKHDLAFRTDLLFGRIELHVAEPRIAGNDLYPRYRIVARDGNGNVTRDETFETGARLENGAPYAHLFR